MNMRQVCLLTWLGSVSEESLSEESSEELSEEEYTRVTPAALAACNQHRHERLAHVSG